MARDYRHRPDAGLRTSAKPGASNHSERAAPVGRNPRINVLFRTCTRRTVVTSPSPSKDTTMTFKTINPVKLTSCVALLGAMLMAPAVGFAAGNPYADPVKPALPASTFQWDTSRTALVVIDPQIDFMSPQGAG